MVHLNSNEISFLTGLLETYLAKSKIVESEAESAADLIVVAVSDIVRMIGRISSLTIERNLHTKNAVIVPITRVDRDTMAKTTTAMSRASETDKSKSF